MRLMRAILSERGAHGLRQIHFKTILMNTVGRMIEMSEKAELENVSDGIDLCEDCRVNVEAAYVECKSRQRLEAGSSECELLRDLNKANYGDGPSTGDRIARPAMQKIYD